MVAPLMAAVGKGLMGMGSKVAGPAITKSLSGRGLATGAMNSKKTEASLDKLKANSTLGLKFLGKMSKGIAKFVSFMAKSSPALKQQLIVLSKGISVILRPIGDIMAKFLRPMSVWVMKVAQKWYSLFGTGSGDKKDKDVIEDEIKQIRAEAESAAISGDEEKAKTLNDKADAMEASLGAKESGSGLGKLFGDLIPDAFKDALKSIGDVFVELWGIIVEVGKILWELLGPALKGIATIIGGALLFVLNAITFVFKGLGFILGHIKDVLMLFRKSLEVVTFWLDKITDIVINALVNSWEILWDTLFKVQDWVYNTFIGVWDSVIEAISSVYDWIKDKFIGIWDSLKEAFTGLWESIKKIIDKITFWKKSDGPEEKAVGGYISETGVYKLHAGERVMTAGDTARSSNNNQSNSFNNYITVQATINNDMDIQDLASRLADLNETELRRRVSY